MRGPIKAPSYVCQQIESGYPLPGRPVPGKPVPGVPVSAFAEFLEPISNNGQQVLFRRVHLDLMALPASPTFEQIQAARMEKALTPLLG